MTSYVFNVRRWALVFCQGLPPEGRFVLALALIYAALVPSSVFVHLHLSEMDSAMPSMRPLFHALECMGGLR